MSRSAPPPSAQEVTRKLSVHSKPKPKKPAPPGPVSGNESDSDSAFSPEGPSYASGSILAKSPSQQPGLSSIAERRSGSGEESDEDDDDAEGAWRAAKEGGSLDETMLMTGYLWKKGERRKTWKKRWFVLRPAHLAFYKTSAEYKLLRLLDLAEVHSCTPVVLKKHANTFGLVSPSRTFYLQAETQQDVQAWVKAINEARTALLSTSTQNSASSSVPIPIAQPAARAQGSSLVSSSLSHSPHGHQLTSSDSDDASPGRPSSHSPSHVQFQAGHDASPSKQPPGAKESPKVLLSGYLMKCGSRRHNWHKRWFVLSGEKLVYSRSHMDTKPHREVPLAQILDALEYDLPAHRHTPSMSAPAGASPPHAPAHAAGDGAATRHTFKVVTTKKQLLLCAPSEEEEIKWLSAVRALIARRSGAGVVPGDGPTKPGAPLGVPSPEGASHAQQGSSVPGNGLGSNALGTSMSPGKRRDSFARRLSLSGGAALVANIVPQAQQQGSQPQAHSLQQEVASERQS